MLRKLNILVDLLLIVLWIFIILLSFVFNVYSCWLDIGLLFIIEIIIYNVIGIFCWKKSVKKYGDYVKSYFVLKKLKWF